MNNTHTPSLKKKRKKRETLLTINIPKTEILSPQFLPSI